MGPRPSFVPTSTARGPSRWPPPRSTWRRSRPPATAPSPHAKRIRELEGVQLAHRLLDETIMRALDSERGKVGSSNRMLYNLTLLKLDDFKPLLEARTRHIHEGQIGLYAAMPQLDTDKLSLDEHKELVAIERRRLELINKASPDGVNLSRPAIAQAEPGAGDRRGRRVLRSSQCWLTRTSTPSRRTWRAASRGCRSSTRAISCPRTCAPTFARPGTSSSPRRASSTTGTSARCARSCRRSRTGRDPQARDLGAAGVDEDDHRLDRVADLGVDDEAVASLHDRELRPRDADRARDASLPRPHQLRLVPGSLEARLPPARGPEQARRVRQRLGRCALRRGAGREEDDRPARSSHPPRRPQRRRFRRARPRVRTGERQRLARRDAPHPPPGPRAAGRDHHPAAPARARPLRARARLEPGRCCACPSATTPSTPSPGPTTRARSPASFCGPSGSARRATRRA